LIKRVLFVLGGILTFLVGLYCGGKLFDVTAGQIQLITMQLDALHESVAAIQSPHAWGVLLFLGSVVTPIVLAMLVLNHADRSSIGSDEMFREAVRHRLTEGMLNAALLDQKKPPARRLPLLVRRIWYLPSRLKRSGKSSDDEKEVH